ncbi:HAD family hydrolase [Mycoplasma seminis]|uniref:HAD family hydrolase n=1 Tax=Mycoplasma seminis TaxID=512749 RepID=A0ABY9HB17_9MOLU|nr:HAD family hydrolase [Mycoplasma seminis]WLP85528.1 HAD family hydrolase [Mycoplasma seminis]
MKKPEIIFIDLDGTTLDTPEKEFWLRNATPYTKQILSELNKTIPVVIATGRGVSPKTAGIVKGITGSETYIAWNGAKTVENGEIVNEEIMPKEVAQALFDELSKNFCFVVYNSNAREQAYVKNRIMRWFMGFGKANAHSYKEYKNDFPVYKALVWSLSAKKMQKLAKKWQKKFEGVLEVSLSGSKNNILEITKANCSKGDEELRYCLSKGIDPKNAMHIGDSMNDASTKGKIGTLVAMQNSVQELKDIADDVTEFTCAQSGLAKYLEQFLDK